MTSALVSPSGIVRRCLIVLPPAMISKLCSTLTLAGNSYSPAFSAAPRDDKPATSRNTRPWRIAPLSASRSPTAAMPERGGTMTVRGSVNGPGPSASRYSQ